MVIWGIIEMTIMIASARLKKRFNLPSIFTLIRQIPPLES
jgi:hypothetical protein